MTRILSINLRSSRRGSILVVGTLSISVLLGFMGLALDASYLYYHKRRMQTAADAGAIAGALELLRGAVGSSTGPSRVTAAAKNDTALNGFTDAQGGVTVTVNNPPVSGPSAGNNAFVEVIISQAQGTWFMRALGTNSATVTARAVANSGGSSPGCIYTLNRGSGNNEGFFINGSSNATSTCGIYSNSNFRAVGTGCVHSAFVSYVDTYSNGTGCTPTVSPGVPFVDPLAGRYTIPPHASCDQTNFTVTSGTNVAIPSGTYCGGITIKGSTASVNFTGGSYVLLGGGLKVTSSVAVTGTGVTFFDTCTPDCLTGNYTEMSITTSGYVNLSAPVSGTYKGLLFYQDPVGVAWASNNGSAITGGPNPSTGASSVFDGILYFPTTDLTYGGGSSVTTGSTDGYTLLIGYNVTINGNSQINSNYTAIGGNPLAVAQFSE